VRADAVSHQPGSIGDLSTASTPGGNARTRAAYTLAILSLVVVFSLMDRQILSILLEPIKRDLGASDTFMGLLTGFAFVAFFALAGLPIARVADRRSRRLVIATALAFWSLMTMLSGVVTSSLQLACARVGLGLGESAVLPAAQSMLSDLYSVDRRAKAMSLLAVATPVGIMLAFVLGGWLNEAVGWRLTFVVLGAPGLLLALVVVLTVDEPQRGAAEGSSTDVAWYGLRQALTYLWNVRAFRYLTLGASLNVFGAWALAVWSAPLLIRVHGMSTAEAGAWLGLATGVGGVVGTLFGGLVTDRLAGRDARWLLLVPALTTLLTVPFIVGFLMLRPPLAPAMYVGAGLFGPAMLGPVMATTQNLAPVRMRALAAAIVAITLNLVGTGLGPLVVGMLSDVLEPWAGGESLRYALLPTITAAMLASAACFGRGARHLSAPLGDVDRTTHGQEAKG
jgi:MFS family permease